MNQHFENGRQKALAYFQNYDEASGFKSHSLQEGPAAYEKGRSAFDSKQPQSTCPYEKGSPNAKRWLEGWRDAKWSAR